MKDIKINVVIASTGLYVILMLIRGYFLEERGLPSFIGFQGFWDNFGLPSFNVITALIPGFIAGYYNHKSGMKIGFIVCVLGILIGNIINAITFTFEFFYIGVFTEFIQFGDFCVVMGVVGEHYKNEKAL